MALFASLIVFLAAGALLGEHLVPCVALVAPPVPRTLLIDPELLLGWLMHLIFRILMVYLPDDLLRIGETLLPNLIL